jgi:hypothetical protein
MHLQLSVRVIERMHWQLSLAQLSAWFSAVADWISFV